MMRLALVVVLLLASARRRPGGGPYLGVALLIVANDGLILC
jgi:hypothetical protein